MRSMAAAWKRSRAPGWRRWHEHAAAPAQHRPQVRGMAATGRPAHARGPRRRRHRRCVHAGQARRLQTRPQPAVCHRGRTQRLPLAGSARGAPRRTGRRRRSRDRAVAAAARPTRRRAGHDHPPHGGRRRRVLIAYNPRHFKVTLRHPAKGLKREAGEAAPCASIPAITPKREARQGVASATVREHGKAPRPENPGSPLASPETGPGVDWLRCGGHRGGGAVSRTLVPFGPSQLQPSVRHSYPTLGARACAPESTHMQLRYLVVSLSLALPASAYAQAATDLDGLVVTGTRTALTADQSLAAVEVIDHAQILRSQARSLQDLLRGRAG